MLNLEEWDERAVCAAYKLKRKRKQSVFTVAMPGDQHRCWLAQARSVCGMRVLQQRSGSFTSTAGKGIDRTPGMRV